MKYLRQFCTMTIVIFGLFVGMVAAGNIGHVFAVDSKTAVCNGIGQLTGGACDPSNPTLGDNVSLTVNILSIVVGIAAVIMLIISGLKYITSNGDSNKISSAKNTILYAVIGLVIVALAQVIVRFTLHKVDTAGATPTPSPTTPTPPPRGIN